MPQTHVGDRRNRPQAPLTSVLNGDDWLRAGRSGIESRWGRDFPPVQTGPGAHPASCRMGTGSFPRVKCGRGVLLNIHPLLVSWSRRVELYLYPPCGSHRACNGITLPLPLLNGDEWSVSYFVRCTSRETARGSHRTRGCVGPRAGLEAL